MTTRPAAPAAGPHTPENQMKHEADPIDERRERYKTELLNVRTKRDGKNLDRQADAVIAVADNEIAQVNDNLKQVFDDTAQDNARLAAALNRVRAIHHPETRRAYVHGHWADAEFCAHCNDDGNGIPWPCETGEALEGKQP